MLELPIILFNFSLTMQKDVYLRKLFLLYSHVSNETLQKKFQKPKKYSIGCRYNILINLKSIRNV